MSFAIMTLWHGAISDRFGRRKVILVALGLFALASAGCTLATRIEHLWFWRAMQGITAGAGMVVSRAIVRDLFDGAAAQRLMSQITMMFALAPAIAPVIGGWLQTLSAGVPFSPSWSCRPPRCGWPAGNCCRKPCRRKNASHCARPSAAPTGRS
jgi:MFS family permease